MAGYPYTNGRVFYMMLDHFFFARAFSVVVAWRHGPV